MLPPTANDMFSRNTSVTPATPRTPAIVVNGVVPGTLDGTGATSTTSSEGSNNGRGYSRVGTELGYSTGKTQTVETDLPGMIEDISVAVSIDRSHFPTSMSVDDLKALVAHAANPKIDPQEVTVVKTDFQHPQTSGGDGGNAPPTGSSNGSATADGQGGGGNGGGFNGMNLIGAGANGANSSNTVNWTLLGAGAAILLSLTMVFLSLMSGRSTANKDTQEVQQTRRDLEQLRQFTVQQQDVIQQSQDQLQAQSDRLLETQQQVQQMASGQSPPVAGLLPVTEGMPAGLSMPAQAIGLPNLAIGGALAPQSAMGNEASVGQPTVMRGGGDADGNYATAPVATSNNDNTALSQRLGASLQALTTTLAQDNADGGTDLSQPLKNWLNS
jgi:TolA-binding protein